MTETLWFSTKSNQRLRHALVAGAGRAACNSRIRPHLFPVYDGGQVVAHESNAKPASELAREVAELCVRCLAAVAVEEYAGRDRFADWDDHGTELELTDNADSISFTTRLVGKFGTLELDVRIRPEDLDRLERRIRDIRWNRGI